MKYKVILTAYFPTDEPAAAIKDALIGVWGQAVNINVGEEDEMNTTIIVEKCYHDEHPPSQCEVIFSKVKG